MKGLLHMNEFPSSPESASEKLVNELAAWLIALEDAAMYEPVRDSLIEHGRMYIHAGVTEKHSGDCTNESHTCVVCSATDAIARAHQILAALQSFGLAQCQQEPIAMINRRLEDLAEANAIYGKDQRLSAPDKIARNEREISWLKDLRSTIALSHSSTDRQVDDAQTLVLGENEKAMLRRIAYARSAGIKLDPFWLDFEAALAGSSPDRASKP